jgi:hypothetical protein
LKGYGIKKFVAASPFIILSMDLLDTPEKVAAFELWCLNVRISSILSCHRVTPSRLIELKRLIPKILKLYAARDMSVSANLHGYSHWIESLSDNGVPREYWCAVFETINGQLKHLFGNTNNKNSSLSVFERYMQLEFVELKLHVEGRPTGFPIPFVIPSNHIERRKLTLIIYIYLLRLAQSLEMEQMRRSGRYLKLPRIIENLKVGLSFRYKYL